MLYAGNFIFGIVFGVLLSGALIAFGAGTVWLTLSIVRLSGHNPESVIIPGGWGVLAGVAGAAIGILVTMKTVLIGILERIS